MLNKRKTIRVIQQQKQGSDVPGKTPTSTYIY